MRTEDIDTQRRRDRIIQTGIECVLPIRFIKDTFMKEAQSHRPPGLSHDRMMEVWNAGIETLQKELDAAETEEEINQVFLQRGRISLHEWIESL